MSDEPTIKFKTHPFGARILEPSGEIAISEENLQAHIQTKIVEAQNKLLDELLSEIEDQYHEDKADCYTQITDLIKRKRQS